MTNHWYLFIFIWALDQLNYTITLVSCFFYDANQFEEIFMLIISNMNIVMMTILMKERKKENMLNWWISVKNFFISFKIWHPFSNAIVTRISIYSIWLLHWFDFFLIKNCLLCTISMTQISTIWIEFISWARIGTFS